MNAYNLRQQCSKEKTKATNPKLSKCIWTPTVRSLDYQRRSIIKQIKHSVLQVKAATLPVTFLLVTVIKLAVEQSFSSNPKSLCQAFTTILTHSIQLMEVFSYRFCFVVLEFFCVLLVWFFNIKGSLSEALVSWMSTTQTTRDFLCTSQSPDSIQGWGLPFQELSLKLPEVKLQDNFRFGYDFYPNC